MLTADEHALRTDTTPRPLCPLSPIELMIVRCIANGDTQRVAANTVGLNPRSIQTTMSRIFTKTSSANAASCVATALRNGWIR